MQWGYASPPLDSGVVAVNIALPLFYVFVDLHKCASR